MLQLLKAQLEGSIEKSAFGWVCWHPALLLSHSSQQPSESTLRPLHLAGASEIRPPCIPNDATTIPRGDDWLHESTLCGYSLDTVRYRSNTPLTLS